MVGARGAAAAAVNTFEACHNIGSGSTLAKSGHTECIAGTATGEAHVAQAPVGIDIEIYFLRANALRRESEMFHRIFFFKYK